MSVYNTLAPVVLEPASQAFVEATAKPPFVYELTRRGPARDPRRRRGPRTGRRAEQAAGPHPTANANRKISHA